MTTILFACVQNAGRSQMAAAFFNVLAAPTKARAISAGTKPAAEVHPGVVTAMREVEIDLTHATPQALTTALASTAQVVVRMGCGDSCPVVPGTRVIDWELRDPHGLALDGVRAVRDDIRARVEDLIARQGGRT